MTDPRIIRTRDSLQAAALEIAMSEEELPLNVAAITQRAGVNRATFYDHYDSPQSVVLAALARDLDVLRETDLALRDQAELPRDEIFRTAIKGVVTHITRFETIYRRSLANPVDGVTHHALSSHFAESIRLIIERQESFPENLNPVVAAEFVAHALVGAFEAWLTLPNLKQDAVVDSILASMPTWWHDLA
ncbi:MAG: TetR/AcrR family transcriptional regulator [Gulosibacter sp.]|uniref:TetR/AcrR family transcriptional regulator n=1 Tax=Gulosibacter sp. TaxID=2817531 RepID=UPI003F8FFC93